MPVRLRALITAVCVTALGALLGALLPATAAHAAGRSVQGGRLDWGIKSSFQSYVTGPIAKGSYSLTGGAATVGGSQFRFHSATGTYDGGTGSFSSSFSGGVHFVGHKEDDGTYQLDLTISRPTVRISGGSGTLYVDIISKVKGTGAVTTSSQVPFASLSVGGIDMLGGGNAVQLNNLPATLTSQGAQSFAGYYTAGTALDPVSLSVDVQAAAKPKASSTPTPTPTKSAEKKETSGAIANGAVDWGVRRTFREYVTGDIAQGKWTLSSGAQDGGALFRFPAGKGTYKKDARSLEAEFEGAVRFTGEQGLDLLLSGLRVTVEDARGTLYADVTSADFTGKKVALATFTAKDLAPKSDLVALTEVPTKLTAQGAKAFGGMYQAGTAMDPLSLAVALTDDAALPALPDLGSSTTASESPSALETATEAKTDTTEAAANTSDGAPVLPLGLGAGVLLLGGAALAFAVRRRRTRTATAVPDED
ncbi:HtaA domain-containing protein [Streptomyces sp. NPDC093544]|uniref:HtaA domain-containing protein n=1 Tax=Streptomyces sp. NPDC093544 TaxID=3155200 RepID=UPI0034250E2A